MGCLRLGAPDHCHLEDPPDEDATRRYQIDQSTGGAQSGGFDLAARFQDFNFRNGRIVEKLGVRPKNLKGTYGNTRWAPPAAYRTTRLALFPVPVTVMDLCAALGPGELAITGGTAGREGQALRSARRGTRDVGLPRKPGQRFWVNVMVNWIGFRSRWEIDNRASCGGVCGYSNTGNRGCCARLGAGA